jgi:hypothetical protein
MPDRPVPIHLSEPFWARRSRSDGQNKGGEELTEEKGRRRGPAALEINGEVSPVVLCVDGVHDGLQRITESPKAWSTIFRAPCNSDEGWLELDVPADVLWARRRSERRRVFGKRRSYQRIQEDEAGLVARSSGSRCSGVPAIPRRSSRAATARSARDRFPCSGAQELAKQCQGVAPGQGEKERCRERSRGGRSLLQNARRSWLAVAVR